MRGECRSIVIKTEGIPIMGKVSKNAEMKCLLDSEEIGTA